METFLNTFGRGTLLLLMELLSPKSPLGSLLGRQVKPPCLTLCVGSLQCCACFWEGLFCGVSTRA